jgi:acetyl/propionyl-CoA carboxylase alpha subunit
MTTRRIATVQALTRDADAASGQIQIDGVHGSIDVRRFDRNSYEVTLAGQRFEVLVAQGPNADWGWVNGLTFCWPHLAQREDREALPDSAAGVGVSADIVSTMPATVSQLAVTVGQRVSQGDTLVLLEAMKMEIPLRAPRDARVAAIHCAEGDTIEPGVTLVDLADSDD